MVAATFMAINFDIVKRWMAPILIVCVIEAIVTWITLNYFGPRFGGENDFERVLGEWGTVTGTNATGLALVRIVDPEVETTTAAELGPANIVNVPASYIVMPSILAYAAGTMSFRAMFISLISVIIGYLIFMRVIGVWGKKTFDIRKGEKYKDGKIIK
jgi:ESS family glutamate:Na+ symporter